MILNKAFKLFLRQNETFKGLLLKHYFIKQKRQDHHDLVLIRHGESEFNKACQDYRVKHKIPYVWKQLCNHEGFDQTVLFNTKFIDCALTQIGKKQCKWANKILQKEDIQCVLVSPQQRALQTCQGVFKGHKAQVIVQPSLIGPIRSCSDINNSLHEKKKMFPTFNFSETEKTKELWFIDYLQREQRQICYQRFEQRGLSHPDQQRKELVQLLREKKINQDAFRYRQRIQRVKKLLTKYREAYGNIAIVAHYYTIEYLGAREYMQCGTPTMYLDIKNTFPYYASLKDFLTIQEEISKSQQ